MSSGSVFAVEKNKGIVGIPCLTENLGQVLTVPEKEHRADGKDFTNMTIIGRPSTWEAPRIRLEPADCRPDCRRLDRLWSRCPTPRAGTGGHPPLRTLPPRLRTGRLWNVILLVSRDSHLIP